MLRKQPEIFWAKPSGLELADHTGQQEKTQLKSPCFLLWSYKFCSEQCAHTQQLRGLGPSRKLAGLGRNYHPAGVSAKARERMGGKRKPRAAKLEGNPKYNVSLVGLVEGKRGSPLWMDRGLCRSLQDLQNRQPPVGCESLKRCD